MSALHDRVLAHPKFAELTHKRNRFSLSLLVIVLAVYYAFIFAAALFPQVLGQPLAAGMTMTVGLPAGILVILFCFIMTGIYVHRANREFDQLNRSLLDEAAR